MDRKKKNIIEIIIVGVAIVSILLGIRAALGLEATESPFYVVSSGSMVPTLNVNDILVVQGGNFDSVKVGDIIVFHRPNVHDKIIVHRVIKIDETNGVRILTTKGDANPSVIPGTDYPIDKDDYIGKVVLVIPKLGYITNAIPPPINYIIVAVIIALIIMSNMNKQKGVSKDGHAKHDDKSDDTSKA